MDENAVRGIGSLLLQGGNKVALIMGPGAVGKSFFTRQIVSWFRAQGLGAESIDLDGYLLSRNERDRMGGLTGYDPRGYDLGLAEDQLMDLIHDGVPQEVRLYDKAALGPTGCRTVHPAEYLIVEGALAFYLEGLLGCSLKVFVTASKRTQFEARYRREATELGYSQEVVRERFVRYWRDYLLYIAPKAEFADVSIRVDPSHNAVVIVK